MSFLFYLLFILAKYCVPILVLVGIGVCGWRIFMLTKRSAIPGSCSECFWKGPIEMTPAQEEIICPQCSHSVPMFDKEDYADIVGRLRKSEIFSLVAWILFAGMCLCFFAWRGSMEMNAFVDAKGLGLEDPDAARAPEPEVKTYKDFEYKIYLPIDPIKHDNTYFKHNLKSDKPMVAQRLVEETQRLKEATERFEEAISNTLTEKDRTDLEEDLEMIRLRKNQLEHLNKGVGASTAQRVLEAKNENTESSQMMYLIGMGVLGIAMLVFGCLASLKKVVCEI